MFTYQCGNDCESFVAKAVVLIFCKGISLSSYIDATGGIPAANNWGCTLDQLVYLQFEITSESFMVEIYHASKTMISSL